MASRLDGARVVLFLAMIVLGSPIVLLCGVRALIAASLASGVPVVPNFGPGFDQHDVPIGTWYTIVSFALIGQAALMTAVAAVMAARAGATLTDVVAGRYRKAS